MKSRSFTIRIPRESLGLFVACKECALDQGTAIDSWTQEGGYDAIVTQVMRQGWSEEDAVTVSSYLFLAAIRFMQLHQELPRHEAALMRRILKCQLIKLILEEQSLPESLLHEVIDDDRATPLAKTEEVSWCRAKLQELLPSLPHQHAAVMNAVALKGLTQEKAAEELSMPQHRVHRLVREAKQMIMMLIDKKDVDLRRRFPRRYGGEL